MKVHHQEVSYRIQALCPNVMSKYVWYYGEFLSLCIYSILQYTLITVHTWDITLQHNACILQLTS